MKLSKDCVIQIKPAIDVIRAGQWGTVHRISVFVDPEPATVRIWVEFEDGAVLPYSPEDLKQAPRYAVALKAAA